MLGLTPWNDSTCEYSIGQLVLRSNSNGKLEVVSLMNINNISSYQMYYDMNFCEKQYNPKIYLGAIASTASRWNLDVELGQSKKEILWLESYQSDIAIFSSTV